jgi:nicotinate phosphoribosyltransferase
MCQGTTLRFDISQFPAAVWRLTKSIYQGAGMNDAASPLLTDLYQLNMIQAYLDHGGTETAVFEFFVRKLPVRRGFLVAAGLEQALAFLEDLRFSDEEIDWLARSRRFGKGLLEYLAGLRFTGDVHAMPEGTIFFPNEPILRVTAPLPQAQLVETRLINILHFQSLIASKAARMTLAAPGKLLVDFGLRRAHGSEAGVMAARASYIAGFAGTATMLAEKLFGIPTFGTMAHSFIQAYDDETSAFEDFAQSRPENLTFLIDTYDTEAAARKVVRLAPRLKARGIAIRSVRLDSGDLAALSKSVRRILDDGGLGEVNIFASGGLDEDRIAEMLQVGAPIDGFGIGTSLTTSSDVPALDCAYKLQEYAGLARRKRSTGKATWPGRKQVWRRFGPDGRMAGDVLSIDADQQGGEPLVQLVMQGGRRVPPSPTLAEIRARAARDLARLPEPLRRLEPQGSYPVHVADALVRLTSEVDGRLAQHDRVPA